MEKPSFIELRNVSKFYGDTPALQNITLDIANGEFLTLLGPSGCGKTTILRLLSGLENLSQGELFLNGKNITDTSPEQRPVNTVFQNYALFPHMTVWDNVAFGLKMKRLPQDEIDAKVAKILRQVRLSEFAKRMPSQLSGGQQQRVAIARAIINNPVVLLLDEPFSALDSKLRKQMQLEMKMLQRELGITFVFVTHDQEEAFAMSDRVVVMNRGTIMQIGSPQEIYEEPDNLFVARFVGEINVLDATILSLKSENIYEASVEGITFSLHTKRKYKKNDKVKVLLRPEDLIVYLESDQALSPPYFSGEIDFTVYKGATVDIVLTLSNGKVLQAAEYYNIDDEEISYQKGDKVVVSWVEGWEVVLDEESDIL